MTHSYRQLWSILAAIAASCGAPAGQQSAELGGSKQPEEGSADSGPLSRWVGDPNAEDIAPAPSAPTASQDPVAKSEKPSTAWSDLAWFESLADVKPGSTVKRSEIAHSLAAISDWGHRMDPWRAMGFHADAEDMNLMHREVDVAAEARLSSHPREQLVLSKMPSLPDVDCVAISSIHRPHVPKDYIYATLKSIFASFPKEVVVNILVGNADTAYLAPEILTAELGEDHLDQIVVIPPSKAMAEYLQQNNVEWRGSWNYARGLLSYRGTRGLVLLEDDVEWAQGSVPILHQILQSTPVPIISLYNVFCQQLQGRVSLLSRAGVSLDQPSREAEFIRTQGLYFSASVANELGRHQFLRINGYCWDRLLNFFLEDRDMDMGYTFPSLLQHRGHVSSGNWGVHETGCYLDDVR